MFLILETPVLLNINYTDLSYILNSPINILLMNSNCVSKNVVWKSIINIINLSFSCYTIKLLLYYSTCEF